MSKTIILTIDGGGIKGIIPSYFLKHIEEQTNKKCYELFDIIGGTSTGGIIATALTSPLKSGGIPYTADEILNIYTENGAEIFVKQGIGLYHAKYYSNHKGKGIEPYLHSIFQNVNLRNSKNNMSMIGGKTKQVFTTSYTINSTGDTIKSPKLGTDYGSYLFNWYDASKNVGDNYYVWEAARATSAAPTYFPVANVGVGSSANERWALDGGVMSNNPTIWAITEALRTGIATDLKDIVVISLGTGTYSAGAGLITKDQGGIVPDNGNWGYEFWLTNDLYDLSKTKNGRGAIINIITESMQLVSNKQMESFKNSGLQYFRLEPEITQAQSKMDNIAPSNIESLENTANNYIGRNLKEFGQIIEILKNQ